jgi:hypothetical protein
MSLFLQKQPKRVGNSWKSRFLAKSNRGKGLEIIEN